jgi:hypothetical protein
MDPLCQCFQSRQKLSKCLNKAFTSIGLPIWSNLNGVQHIIRSALDSSHLTATPFDCGPPVNPTFSAPQLHILPFGSLRQVLTMSVPASASFADPFSRSGTPGRDFFSAHPPSTPSRNRFRVIATFHYGLNQHSSPVGRFCSVALLRNFPITSQFWVPVATVKSIPARHSGAAHEKRTLPQLWAVPSSRRTRLGPPLLHYVGPVVTVVALPQLSFPTVSDEHQRLEMTPGRQLRAGNSYVLFCETTFKLTKPFESSD